MRMPVRHGLGLFLSNLLQVCLPTGLIILLQGPSDGRVLCSLATFTLASARSAWACSASVWALAAFAWVLASAWALRPSPATRAWDVCSRPSPGFGTSTSAPDWPWTMRLLLSEPPSASVLTPVTRAARGAARRPLHIEVHRLRLPQEGLGLSVALARVLGPLRSAGRGNSVAGRAASLNRPGKDSGK
jgi:hypothetical protein